jgi:hypothetical protein
MLLALGLLGWPVAAWMYLRWCLATREADGWRRLFELHFVNPNLKSH